MWLIGSVLKHCKVPKYFEEDFRFLINPLLSEICHNSKTSDDIVMKLRPVSKLDKKNEVVKKNNDYISAHCDAIVAFPVYGQFGAIQKPDL